MFSSWFGSKSDSPNNDTGINADGGFKPPPPPTKKINRISKSWVQSPGDDDTRLQMKAAQHNLLDSEASVDQFENVCGGMSDDDCQTKRYTSYLPTARIVTRPLHIVKKSDSDILKFKEETYDFEKTRDNGKFVAISILPADEMNTLTSEIKLWHKTRKSFKSLFNTMMICGIVLLTISVTFSLLWYSDKSLIKGMQFKRNGTFFYNMHMNGQVIHLVLLSIAINLFRLFPQTKLFKIILYHAVLGLAAFTISGISVCFAINYHEEFTGNDKHFYSLHSWLGITTYIWYTFVFMSGIGIMYYPSSKMKESHTNSGIMTFMLCGACTICGFFYRALIQLGKQYINFSIPGILINVFGVFVVILCIFGRITAANFLYRRRPKPLWDVIVYRSMEAIEDIYLEIHDMYDSFELWIKQVNQARLKALRVPHTLLRWSMENDEKSQKSNHSVST